MSTLATPGSTTRRDHVIALALAACVAAAGVVIATSGTASQAQFHPADEPAPIYTPADYAPEWLAGLWSRESGGPSAPVVTDGELVTVADDGTLVALEAGTGDETWSYAPPGEFCAATYAAGSVIGVYDTGAGCGSVTAVDPDGQTYSATRMSMFSGGPDDVDLIPSRNHALLMGPDRLESWRSDLVTTVAYGHDETPQEPDSQPRADCTLFSAALDDERFALSEYCPGDFTARLTVSSLVPEDARAPEEVYSGETGAEEMFVLGLGTNGALTLESHGGRWSVWFRSSPDTGRIVLDDVAAPEAPPGPDTVTEHAGRVLWFDGHGTHAFDLQNGTHAWTRPDTTGPGTVLGAHDENDAPGHRPPLVALPVPSGVAFVGTEDGHEHSVMDVRDPARDGVPPAPVGLSQIGDVLYEHTGDVITAFKMCTAATDDPACQP